MEAATTRHDQYKKRSRRFAILTSQAFSIANFRGPLITELVRRGITVLALAPDFDDLSRNAVVALGATPVDTPMTRAGMNPLHDVADFIRLIRLLHSLDVDVFLAYFIKPVIYGMIAARLAGVPKRFAMIEGAGYVFGDDDKASMGRRILRALVRKLYRISLRHAERVFMLNHDDQEQFVSERMLSPHKVQLLDGTGLDLNYYQMSPPVIQPICFILVARLLREKGVYVYINAARRIKAMRHDIRFLLLGSVDPNPGSVTLAEISEWVAEGLIEHPGHVQDVRPWLAQASVFVLPSYYREGLPRSIQEAMAMGRPIITTNWVGCKETVDEGVNGYKVPIRNVDAVVEAMMKFIDRPELVAKMSGESRRIAESRFDVHKINALMLETMNV
jgi:glycosyltransferase involved in cell wall biosynthesis